MAPTTPTLSIRPGPLRGRLRAPSSKSVTNRLLAMTALAAGESEIEEPLLSDDTVVMASGLTTLGAPVELGDGLARVRGAGGRLHPVGPVHAGLSGTTLRFLSALSLLADAPVLLDGGPGLRRRPLRPLLEVLAAAGATVSSEDGHAPVLLHPAGLSGGRLVVDAAESSQFATALLLVAPYAEHDLEVVIENLGAGGYVELTVALMTRLGAKVARRGDDGFLVEAGRHYAPGRYRVEYDASAAAHLFAAAVASGGEVTVTNAAETLQPDGAVPALLGAMGAQVTPGPAGGVTVAAPAGGLRAIRADLAAIPDQLPTFAVLATLANGESHLSGLGVSRGHESDRPRVVCDELSRLGADACFDGESLVVRGGRALSGGRAETYDDHRMAMAFSALATAVPGVSIANPGCVGKTYPRWWDDLAALGARLEG